MVVELEVANGAQVGPGLEATKCGVQDEKGRAQPVARREPESDHRYQSNGPRKGPWFFLRIFDGFPSPQDEIIGSNLS
jgi:hypothetical protein